MAKFQTITEAKAHLNEIVDALDDSTEEVVLTRHGKPAAILLGWDSWEGLLETIDIMSTPGAMDDLREARASYDAGEYLTIEQVEASLRARGTVAPEE
jgi:prevent-host-death family protein